MNKFFSNKYFLTHVLYDDLSPLELFWCFIVIGKLSTSVCKSGLDSFVIVIIIIM